MRTLPAPVCHGMSELAFAAHERTALNAVIASSDDRNSNYTALAQDVIHLHILYGLAVTAGSAYGERPPNRELCWRLFTAPTAKTDKQAVQMHVGGKAFTKHSHRASSGWCVSSVLFSVCTHDFVIAKAGSRAFFCPGGASLPDDLRKRTRSLKLLLIEFGTMQRGGMYSGSHIEC